MMGNHGIGSSLFSRRTHLVCLVDHGPSYLLLRIDKKTGRTPWRNEREERVSGALRPLVESQDEETVFISSNGIVEAYDFDGEKLGWEKDDIRATP